MIELPKRDDGIYKKIEGLKDYELTQCTAYEMAIRDDGAIKLKNKIDQLLEIVWFEFIKERDNDTELSKEYTEIESEYDKKYYDNDYNNDDLEIPNFHKYFLDRNNNALQIKENIQILINDYWIRYLYEEDIIWEASTMLGVDTVCREFLSRKQEKRLREHGFIGLFEHVGMSKDNRVVVSNDIGFVFGKGGNAHKEVDLNKILISQELESLVIPKKYDTSLNIKINLNLSKNELIAYISKIKDDYTKDSGMIKSPLELLGEDLEKSDTRISKKKLADKFFVYDYVKVRLKQIDALNQEVKDDFNGVKLNIKNNNFLSGTDKKIQIEALKQELKENLINTKINEIFEDEYLNGEISQGTAKRYYYEMKLFIDDLKYKELIARVTN